MNSFTWNADISISAYGLGLPLLRPCAEAGDVSLYHCAEAGYV
jgi:hypothetical protein